VIATKDEQGDTKGNDRSHKEALMRHRCGSVGRTKEQRTEFYEAIKGFCAAGPWRRREEQERKANKPHPTLMLLASLYSYS
jgi:hypothetical protein